jgi:hypothetical protein
MRGNITFTEPDRKRTLGRSRHRWEGNIGKDLREIWWEIVE